MLLDSTGPRVLSHTPLEVRNDVFDHIEVVFSEAIDGTTFTVDDVSINGPAGEVAATGVSPVSGSTYRIDFSPLTVRGNYEASVGSDIADLAGNLMDQNEDGTNGDPASDFYHANFVYIDASIIFTASTMISAGDTTYDGEDLLIDGATVTIDGPHSFNSIHLVDGAVVTHYANVSSEDHRLDLTVAEQVIIDSTSQISADGRGYDSENGPGAGLTDGPAGGGGGYGGVGGNGGGSGWPIALGGSSYGSITAPSDLGSGGGDGNVAEAGGAGGGAISLMVGGTLHVDGALTANGTDGQPIYGGGGSGGSLHVVAATLSGSGTIEASGGNAYPPSGFSGGGGSGGRIALYYDVATYSGSLEASGGAGHYQYGGAGTIYTKAAGASYGVALVENDHTGALTPIPAGYTGGLTVGNGAMATTEGAIVLSEVNVASDGLLMASAVQILT